MIIVECYKDCQLVYRMDFIPDQVEHAFGKTRVLAAVDQKRKAIGIIDEDPQAGRPAYLKEYDEKDALGSIRLLKRKDDDEKRVVQISPRLEDWLYSLAKRNKVFPEKFKLPSDPKELHNRSLKRDKDFRSFLIELVSKRKDDEINTLRQWIREAIEQ